MNYIVLVDLDDSCARMLMHVSLQRDVIEGNTWRKM